MFQFVLLKFAVLVSVLSITNGDGYLPDYIKPCHHEVIESCLKSRIPEVLPQFAKGIPELGVPSLDPVKLDDIIINGNSLKLVFTDPYMYGLSQAKLIDMKVNIEDLEFALSIRCNLNLTAKYSIDGQILILPIKGEGDALVETKNIDVKIKSKIAHVKDAKGEHYKLVTPNYSYDIEKTRFQLDNLFNGNKQLSEATHQFANENWRQLMDDLAPPAVKQIVRNVLKAINKFFAGVTIQQIIIGV